MLIVICYIIIIAYITLFIVVIVTTNYFPTQESSAHLLESTIFNRRICSNECFVRSPMPDEIIPYGLKNWFAQTVQIKYNYMHNVIHQNELILHLNSIIE